MDLASKLQLLRGEGFQASTRSLDYLKGSHRLPKFVTKNVEHLVALRNGLPERSAFCLIIIAVPVVPMTVVAPVPVPIRTVIVIVGGIVATVVYRVRIAIGRSDRYAKVTASLRFLGHESDEPKRQQNWEKIFFHEINLLTL